MKTSTLVIVGLGTLGVGFLAYKFMKDRGASPYADPNQAYLAMGGRLTQPSQLYPVQPIQSPRVDNRSEPWYPGSHAVAGQGPALDMNFTQNVAYVKGLGEITSSLSSIWNDVGGWFDDEPEAEDESWDNWFTA